MPFPPRSSGVGPVIAEVEMNAGANQDATTMRATVVQACSMFYDTPATFDKAEKLIAEAAGYGSQLVLFPEVFVGGHPHGSTFGLTIGCRSAKGKEDFWKYHVVAIDVPEHTAVCAGGSSIISPSGAVLAGPNYEGEALLTADLDIGEIVQAKFDFNAVGH